MQGLLFGLGWVRFALYVHFCHFSLVFGVFCEILCKRIGFYGILPVRMKGSFIKAMFSYMKFSCCLVLVLPCSRIAGTRNGKKVNEQVDKCVNEERTYCLRLNGWRGVVCAWVLVYQVRQRDIMCS